MTPRKVNISADEDVASMLVLASHQFIRDFRRRNRSLEPEMFPRWERVVESIRRQLLEMESDGGGS